MQALVKFNEALAHNKRLRSAIDNLRKERVVFDNLYRKMENDLQKKKRDMASVIEQSNLAYEARDALQAKVAELQQKDLREHKIFEEKMAGMDRRLMKQPDKHVPDANANRGKMSIEEEEDLAHRVNKAAWLLSKEKANIQVCMDDMISYQ